MHAAIKTASAQKTLLRKIPALTHQTKTPSRNSNQYGKNTPGRSSNLITPVRSASDSKNDPPRTIAPQYGGSSRIERRSVKFRKKRPSIRASRSEYAITKPLSTKKTSTPKWPATVISVRHFERKLRLEPPLAKKPAECGKSTAID